tara:strand:- start:18735 stop:19382 length:648 start_codon:yes stop_codon:yes gene_type:complete
MAKKIFPGNWVTNLSSYQGQPVVAIPGRVYYHKVGYALITSTAAKEWDVVIPSPDMRGDDKVRADIEGLSIPEGATIYSLGLRVSDTRKDVGVGSAASGLTGGTNGETLRLASVATATAAGAISATAAGTKSADLTVASETIAPGSSKFSSAGATLTSGITLKVFLATSAGNVASSNTISSSAAGGTPIICEVSYYLDDEVATKEDTRIPYQVES